MLKNRLCIISFLFLISKGTAQVGDVELRNYFNSIIFLRDSITRVEEFEGKRYEIYLKDPRSEVAFPLKYIVSGSGFIVNKDFDNYLVTAQHVANSLSANTSMIFKGRNGKREEIILKDLILPSSKWVFHPNADVAVIPLNITEDDGITMRNVEIGFLDYWDISRARTAPDRFEDLIVVGFPLGLGESPKLVSPITKKVKTSSDLISLNRFDNGKPSNFYLLDDPSASGFSGGPVIRIYDPLMSKDRKSYLPGQMRILGIVHGTINDPKDKAGRFAAIVPSYLVIETIDMAPSYSGIYTYKYSDGAIWSKVSYKNGIPWTVFSNFKPDGTSQEQGTLKNGTGTLFKYDEKGKLLYVETYNNGVRTGLSPAMTDDELRKFGGFRPVETN